MSDAVFTPAFEPLSNRIRSRHRLAFSLVFCLLLAIGVLLFADFLWRTGMDTLKSFLLVLFTVLFAQLSFGFCTAFFGFFARRQKGAARTRITASIRQQDPLPTDASTALLIPIYNEDVATVFANLRTTFRALDRLGILDTFDFFILSDSRDPEIWIREEAAWKEVCLELDAFSRIHYRHRRENTDKKSGNISEFLSTWGAHYRYMVIYDADSLMAATTLGDLVRAMEANPQIGILQTAPGLYRGETLFARLQQFANRMYGRIYLAGLNFWQLAEGNYWGHNAIIRVKPFIEACELPRLPADVPLGGAILSHDFVEAALMRQAGFEVWLAYDLEGSFEEGPPQLSESLQRDRRWCQGNLQHSWLLFSRNFTFLNRLHFLLGIMAYAGSAVWFGFLLLSTLLVVSFAQTNLTLIATAGFTRWIELSLVQHGLVLLGFTALVLYGPKVLSLLDLALDRPRARLHGGIIRASLSTLLETIASATLAPILMIRHTLHIIGILLGARVSWGSQTRVGGGLTLREALLEYGAVSLLGLLWGLLAYRFDAHFFYWLLPVCAPLVLAPWIAQLMASGRLGRGLRTLRLLLTPEETQPTFETGEAEAGPAEFRARLSETKNWLARAVADPFLNALHVALEQRQDQKGAAAADPSAHEPLLAKLFRDGPANLSREEASALLVSPGQMDTAYHEVWSRSSAELAPAWKDVLRSYRQE